MCAADTVLHRAFLIAGVQMDSEFLKQQADRCRSLAEKADRFTKKRLLDLAAKYDDRLTRALRSPRGEEPPHPPPNLGFIR